MKIKPRGSAKPGECCVVDCHKPREAFGFCKEHRAEVSAALERAKGPWVLKIANPPPSNDHDDL
jgi:hypothetical protein